MKIRASRLLLCAPLLLACTSSASSTYLSTGVWWQNRKAEQLRNTDRCREAIQIWERQIATMSNKRGYDALMVARRFTSLAACKLNAGEMVAAEALLNESLRLNEMILGYEHSDVAAVLNNLGVVKLEQGEFNPAEDLFRESLRITEKLRGHEHSDVATILDHLGLVKRSRRDLNSAEDLFRESLRITEKLRGHEHSDVATVLNHLGLVKRDGKELNSAEDLFRESLRITEKLRGHEHSDVATILNHLGWLKLERGELKESRELFRESLRVNEKSLGPEHRYVATSLYVLATAGDPKEQLAESKSLLLRAINILRQVELQPLSGRPQAVYADLLLAQGKKNEAEAYLKEAVQFARQSPDAPDNPLNLRLIALGRYYQEAERYEEAEQAFEEAITLSESQGVRVLTDLLAWYSEVLVAQGTKSSQRIAEARKWTMRALRQDLDELQELFLALDDQELERRLSEQAKRIDFLFGLLNKRDVTQAQRQFALAVSLARKALSIAADATGSQAFYASLPESARSDLEQLRLLWQEESKWSMRSRHPNGLNDAMVQNRYRSTVEKRRALHQKLVKLLPEQYQQIDLAFDDSLQNIAKQLRPREVFLDLVLHLPPQFSTGSRSPIPRTSQGRYHAFLLYPDGHVIDRDLGPANAIEHALRAMSHALDKRGGLAVQRSANAYQLTLAPLAPLLQKSYKIYVAGDGEFVRHQLGLLHDGRCYLIDRFFFSPLSSGRDLRPSTAPRSDAHGFFSFVNPSIGSRPLPSVLASMRSNPRSLCWFHLSQLPDLTGSKREGEVIRELFPDAQVFESGQASEEHLLQIKQPLVLHLSTHGMDCSSEAETRQDVRSTRGTLQEAATESADSSILLMAGAEHYLKQWIEKGIASGVFDGLVTYAELSRMDLRGTQLVVLASCLSGMGAVSRGQGLLGLRSALFVAGAETVVTTLGSVDDKVTAQLMEAYYRHLKAGEGRISALRLAALEIKRHHPDPFYWAPFLAVGRDEPLQLNP